MIELFYWTTPNGHKMTIFLEEAQLDYNIVPINISEGAQFKPSFLKISPNNKIPALVDNAPKEGTKPISVFESGAMLVYLADKTQQFIGKNLQQRTQVLEWLFWQVGGLGPMSGQAMHFVKHASEKNPYAITRYMSETLRLYKVLDNQLSHQAFIAGDYSIADMSSYPWIVAHQPLQIELDDFPNIQRWFNTIKERPAVQRAYEKAKQINPSS